MSRLEKLCEEAQRLFNPRIGVLHQSKEFYAVYDKARQVYKEEQLFSGTERVDPFSHPHDQADGVYK